MFNFLSMNSPIHKGKDAVQTAVRKRFVWELDWNLLRTFTIIVQERSLTAAGEKLLLQQPTISNALRRLEDHMGKRLIDRNAGAFAVTEAGQRLYAECVAMFEIASNLPSLMDERPDDLTGHIELAFTSHCTSPFLDDRLAAFHKNYPKVTFAISISPSEEVVRSILRKTSSMGLCLAHARHPDLTYTCLYREQFGFFCGPGHRLFGRTDVRLEDLRAEPYVSFKTDEMSDALWPIALLRLQNSFHGVVAGTSSNLEEVRRFIIAGLGFGPLPIHVVADDIARGRLWQLPPLQDPPTVDVFVVHDAGARRSKPEQRLLDFLLGEIAEHGIDERSYPLRVPLS